ncbi:cilia- and flagella-associated protein 251 isoform X1 [Lingula anatina]|uniref:Cilia- and flagella-associated protein 251 n=1 Tax=Lingula anatina TaxID=7574 RepID=A0A1S3K1S6_LINAN|nr:cilia- and flagella-associated protein 251 isoform X1 [Lingula anatina]|eukprot:XP_013416583.1 cilia- and flagella-associated protein 251 isoform X1 [Lingula anatina]
MNKNIPVLNLTDPNRKMIAYACAHAGILYNFRDNTQKILQGHCNPLSCMCTSADKRWLVTADKGRDNLVIIWDTSSGVPVQTLFDPHPEVGVAAIAMTPDAKYIATISAAEDQTLSIWDWTVDGEKPVCKTNLKAEYGHQHYIHFNPDDTFQLVSNSESQVIFYSWSSGQLEYFAPPLQDEDFNKQVGRYSQTIYQTNSSRALTATSVGNLVVWDNNKPLTKVVSTDPSPDKKALKLVKLQDRAINVLTTTDGYIVTGDVLGHVRFLDQTLKLIMWYQDFNLGPISSISFACDPQFHDRTEDTWEEEQFGQHQSLRLKDQREYPADATIKAQKLIIRDFVVGTSTAVYGHITTQGTIIDVIHRDHDASVHALAAHPFRPQIAMGSYSGLLKLWDYEKRIVIASRYFERGNMIRCCSFDPTGSFIAVGFMNGAVNVVNAFDLQDECSEPFRYARDVITHCAFSHDSQYLATADGECTVSVFKAQHTDGEEPWIYLGRHRAHYKLIKDLIFGVQLDSNLPRLMSLGADRVLVEYDLQNSGKDDLRVMESDRIEQSAQPLCLTWYPALKKEHFILTVNDQYKFKLYNSTTKMCRKTLLGPTYGSPIQKIAIIPTPDPDNSKRYLAYINDDKVGLHMLPLDGNPHNAMALVAHPTGVANLACSYDGKYVFTAGGPDCTVHMWQLNVLALEAQSKMGGEDLIPFYGLLDGGRDGELFAELENYFYYAQIRSQGVNTMDTRAVSVKIPLSEVPYVMMAMGFYPSQQEIQDMLNEVKYSEYVETGKYVEEIDLGEFIRLYINHRPAFGLSPERLAAAFETLGLPTEQGYAIDRGELLDLLQSKGEHMTEYELAECLTTLLGFNAEGGSSEMHEFDPSTAGDIIEENLPQDITVDMFADELLGFSMYVPPGLPEGLATHETQTETLET